MLGRLIKHEFKITGRYIMIVMIILAIVTPLTAAYLRFSSDMLSSDDFSIFQLFSGICMFLYVCAMIAVGAATYILILYRFYKSMVTSEAYLTHTLPVKTSSLITSKLIVAFIWEVASTLLMIASLLVFTRILGLWKFSEINWDNIRMYYNKFIDIGFSTGNLIEIIVLILISMISSLLICFVSFSIGQRMNGHPFLGSVITFIVITVVLQIVSSIFMFAYSLYFNSFDSGVMINVNPAMHVFIMGNILFHLVICIFYYVTTVYMFKKKLNI